MIAFPFRFQTLKQQPDCNSSRLDALNTHSGKSGRYLSCCRKVAETDNRHIVWDPKSQMQKLGDNRQGQSIMRAEECSRR